MKDRSALLKIYNDRTALLNRGPFQPPEFTEYLRSNELLISNRLCTVLQNCSTLFGRIHPELLIESILQYLKGKRGYAKESQFVSMLFEFSHELKYEAFRQRFLECFTSTYEANEMSRILQLVKRFGLDSEENVTYEYLFQLVQTSRAKVSDGTAGANKIALVLKKLIMAEVWKLLLEKPARKPLAIISNVSMSITSEFEIKGRQDSRTKKSQELRSKLFAQACRNFLGYYLEKLRKESFFIVKNPYKFRDPYIHRAIFKTYLRLKRNAVKYLSNSLMRWNNMPENLIDSLRSTMFYPISKESTANVSRNFLALTQGFKEKNSRASALLLQLSLKAPMARFNHFTFQAIIKIEFKALDILFKILENQKALTLLRSFGWIKTASAVAGLISSQNDQLKYHVKRQKYSLANKGRKLAARALIRVFSRSSLRSWFIHYYSKTRFNKHRLSKSFSKTVKRPEANNTQRAFSNSFATSPAKESSYKYEEMRSSVKKIKFHHGFEKLWLTYRRLSKRYIENPCVKAYITWKGLCQKKRPLSLKTHKVTRTTNHSQFSFRDKY